jgi:hypothetical protein
MKQTTKEYFKRLKQENRKEKIQDFIAYAFLIGAGTYMFVYMISYAF